MSQESQTYQAMLQEVEAIVKEVSAPNLDLDGMVAKVERGYQLIQSMGERLQQTKARIEELSQTFEQQAAEDT